MSLLDLKILQEYLRNKAAISAHSFCYQKLDEYEDINIDLKKVYYRNCMTKSIELLKENFKSDPNNEHFTKTVNDYFNNYKS